ncbi:U3 snoRNP protein [Datura stramonium]|uniref:U3 snoRNP protein n=1 Tax=Datura stramonium TaxID=4076 RepID=A0ABS8TLN8_DATST|nr:U3 snoRNP protein [Datura stramonium]
MADVVQYKLERMLPELDDLERRGLFSRREIAEIVKQRRKFEYRLKRPSPLKQDFVSYIDYEKSLESLRLLRKKAQMKKTGDRKLKKSVSDYAGVSRIIEIYRLATNRFKGDVELWFQYLEFCRERRNGRMKKALAQVIRFHPKVPGVWIYAAAWEFDNNLNAAAARALMHSGLRACPTSEDLWVEYLRMELTYLNKLKARKVVLGEAEGTLARSGKNAKEEQWRDENKELFMALDDKREDEKLSNLHDGDSKEKLDSFREQGLSVLQTVYSGSIKALPSSFSLRTQFLEILEATDLAHSEDMRNEILADMKRDFSREPKYWDWLARQEVIDLNNPETTESMTADQLSRAIQVFEEGLKIVPSASMFDCYAKFLMDVIHFKDQGSQSIEQLSAASHAMDPISHLLAVYEKAETMGCITEDLACQHVSFLLQLGKVDEAKTLVEKLCSGKFSEAVQLWDLRVSIEMRFIQKNCTPNKTALSSIFEPLRNVLLKVPISEAETLWLMALRYFSAHKQFLDKLVETSMTLLAKDGGSDDGFSLSSTIVSFVLQRDGLGNARELYKRFLALPHPGLSLYRNCIELELNLASSGDKISLGNAQKLFETALKTYDQDVGLWQDYYNMEVKMGTSETAAAVNWRARKTLKKSMSLLPSQ